MNDCLRMLHGCCYTESYLLKIEGWKSLIGRHPAPQIPFLPQS